MVCPGPGPTSREGQDGLALLSKVIRQSIVHVDDFGDFGQLGLFGYEGGGYGGVANGLLQRSKKSLPTETRETN